MPTKHKRSSGGASASADIVVLALGLHIASVVLREPFLKAWLR
jgi:hypothetical protein